MTMELGMELGMIPFDGGKVVIGIGTGTTGGGRDGLRSLALRPLHLLSPGLMLLDPGPWSDTI